MKHLIAPAEKILPPEPRSIPEELVIAPNSRAVQNEYARGNYVRLGPGVYVPTQIWLDADASFKLLALCSAKVLRSPQTVFAGEAALFLAGLPVFGTPGGILTVTDAHSRLGAEKGTLAASSSASGPLQTSVAAAPRIFRKQVRHVDPVRTGDFTVMQLPDAVADVAARLPLLRALTVADGLARFGHRLGLQLSQAHDAADALTFASHVNRAHQVLDLARPGAATPFETGSRCVMLQHGFQEPVLQRPHFDEIGRFIGFTDTHWEDRNTSGEADGRIKYTDPRILGGRSPEDVLLEEKIRQQRIEATGVRIIRWQWSDMIHPDRLVRILRLADIPADPSWRIRLL
ncbi:MAG: hypothetical protein ACTIJJ_06330 [Galactobacter sp.]